MRFIIIFTIFCVVASKSYYDILGLSENKLLWVIIVLWNVIWINLKPGVDARIWLHGIFVRIENTKEDVNEPDFAGIDQFLVS